MQGFSAEMLLKLKDYNLMPNVIYIDSAHDYESVKQDVALCLELFPQSILIGDDWNWGDRGVNKAVIEIFEIKQLKYQVDQSCWFYVP